MAQIDTYENLRSVHYYCLDKSNFVPRIPIYREIQKSSESRIKQMTHKTRLLTLPNEALARKAPSFSLGI